MYYPRLYGMVSGPWRRLRGGVAMLAVLDRALVVLVGAGYVAALVWLAASGDARWVRFACVPGATLVLVSVVRRALDAPRPYEQFNVDALLPATTKGRSMPSRHVASAAVIACALGWLQLRWGVEAGAAAVLVAYTRVAGGLHFPRDVAAGLALGAAAGLVGFFAL